MSITDRYKTLLEQNMQTLQSFPDFEKLDKAVASAYEVARKIFTEPASINDPKGMLRRGHEMAGLFGYLAAKQVEKKAEYEVAEITRDTLRDELLLEYRDTEPNITSARAKADIEMADASLDVVSKKALAGYYESAAEMCSTTVSLAQSSCKVMLMEMSHSRISDQGAPDDLP